MMFNPGDTVRHISGKGCNATVVSSVPSRVSGYWLVIEINRVKLKYHSDDLELVEKGEKIK